MRGRVPTAHSLEPALPRLGVAEGRHLLPVLPPEVVALASPRRILGLRARDARTAIEDPIDDIEAAQGVLRADDDAPVLNKERDVAHAQVVEQRQQVLGV